MSNLALIVPRRADFDTAQAYRWSDGFPLIGQAGAGGVASGPANAGNGTLAVLDVAAGARRGVYLCTVTAVRAGLALVSIEDPDGDVVGAGMAGLPLDAAGLRLSLTQGASPFAAGDAFAVTVLTAPVDLTGLRFRLVAMLNARSATRMLALDSAPDDGSYPTLIAGGPAGSLAAYAPRAVMAGMPPGDYPYAVAATDPATDPGRLDPVPVFYGTIRHRAVLAPSAA